MDVMFFFTQEEAEAVVSQKREENYRHGVPGTKRYMIEKRYFVKRQMAVPDAPFEYLMEDGSFKKEGGGPYKEFDLDIHVV